MRAQNLQYTGRRPILSSSLPAGRFPMVEIGGMHVYLDHNATTPLDPA